MSDLSAVGAQACRPRRRETATQRRPVQRRDVDGRSIRILPTPLMLPEGRCLTDIWPHLTPQKRLAWLLAVEPERCPPRAVEDEPEPEPLVWGESSREHIAALEALAEVGAVWDDALTWALASGRWSLRQAREKSPEVVAEYLAVRARYDEVTADPQFWRELAQQCSALDVSGEYGLAVRFLGEGARLLTELVAADQRTDETP